MTTNTSGAARVNGVELGYLVAGEGVTHYDINVTPALPAVMGGGNPLRRP